MTLSGAVFLASVGGLLATRAAATDATTPPDYTSRQTAFAPAATVTPPAVPLARADALQEKRVDFPAVDKRAAAWGERRAAVSVTEARPKAEVEKDSHRPEAAAPELNAMNHRAALITTAGDTTKPALVARYQDRLTAASATNMERFPAADRATIGRVNRFVFRKNESAAAEAAPVVPAAGGSAVQR
jgi:hypothetical protein